MDGKLLYGAGGNLLPKRLVDGYQDAIFAWSGDYPYANIAQSNVYSIDSRSSYDNNWLVKTPYGRGFRAPSYSSSGWVETLVAGKFENLYSGGITVYCKFVLESHPSSSQFPSYFGLFDDAPGHYYGGIVLGVEYGDASKQRHVFRVGNSSTNRHFNNDPTGLNVPVGTLIQAAVTFHPGSKRYTSVYQYKDTLHVYSGTGAGLYMSYRTIIRLGGYNRPGNRAAQTTSVLEAALWNRSLDEKDLLYLIGRRSVYQERASGLILFGRGGGADIISCSTAELAVSASVAAMVEVGDSVIGCTSAALAVGTTAASILETVTVLATPDIITLSGVSSSVRTSEAIQAKPATIGLTGVTSSISMTGAIEIPAKPATISISGVNASINLTGQIQIYAIPATITLVANSAALVQHAVVNTQPDALVLQPESAGLYAGEAVVDATAKALTFTPAQAAIVQHAVLVTTPDNIALHGSQAELQLTNILAANTADISLYGAQARLYSTEILSGKPDSILLQGNQALIRSVGVVDTLPDNIGIFGQQADIAMSMALATTPASMTLGSLRAQINIQSSVVWGNTSIEARLQGMTIEARLQGMTIEARQ